MFGAGVFLELGKVQFQGHPSLNSSQASGLAAFLL
jgi:hypothetical protein